MNMKCMVRSFTGTGRITGMEWTLIYPLEYDFCNLLGQSGLGLPQKAISPTNMQLRYPKSLPRTVGR